MNIRYFVPSTPPRPPREVVHRVEKMAGWPDVRQIAVMPDAHIAGEGCVGVVLATQETWYPQAVGADIGCGMAALPLGPSPQLTTGELQALLPELQRAVPAHRHASPQVLPQDLNPAALSHPALSRVAARDGAVQFATLGRGNHFLELQRDEQDHLWLTVHTGSRAVGQAIYDFHTVNPITRPTYASDLAWARRYAHESRLAILRAAADIFTRRLGTAPDFASLVSCDHNHAQIEQHGDRQLIIHRKGATPAARDQPGIIAGSMATFTVLTLGRGNSESLASSSHGAGRRLSRTEARQNITIGWLRSVLDSIAYDTRLLPRLVEEAPAAYRDLRDVLHAQRELVKTTHRLTPLLIHKSP